MFEIDLFCPHCGKKVLLDPDYQVTIKDEAWEKARDHLFDAFVSEFEKSQHGVVTALVSLKKRFDKGERTHELYKEIMSHVRFGEVAER